MKSKKVKKKYVAIGKIGNNPDKSAHCIKHWTNNIEKWIIQQGKKYQFRWVNFYYNTGTLKGQQFKSWTSNKGFFDNIR